jgi:hypothetical protein
MGKLVLIHKTTVDGRFINFTDNYYFVIINMHLVLPHAHVIIFAYINIMHSCRM